ncbi:hypothetical protein BDZ88DRAFT_426227 [Geranomyces variabilis]|nr:hypothetical protein BDZ88DRAFT_426227 [Geranomyces variabilis]
MATVVSVVQRVHREKVSTFATNTPRAARFSANRSASKSSGTCCCRKTMVAVACLRTVLTRSRLGVWLGKYASRRLKSASAKQFMAINSDVFAGYICPDALCPYPQAAAAAACVCALKDRADGQPNSSATSGVPAWTVTKLSIFFSINNDSCDAGIAASTKSGLFATTSLYSTWRTAAGITASRVIRFGAERARVGVGASATDTVCRANVLARKKGWPGRLVKGWRRRMTLSAKHRNWCVLTLMSRSDAVNVRQPGRRAAGCSSRCPSCAGWAAHVMVIWCWVTAISLLMCSRDFQHDVQIRELFVHKFLPLPRLRRRTALRSHIAGRCAEGEEQSSREGTAKTLVIQ